MKIDDEQAKHERKLVMIVAEALIIISTAIALAIIIVLWLVYP